MSQISKQVKKLSRKHVSKHNSIESNLSIKCETKEDESLLSVGTLIKYKPCSNAYDNNEIQFSNDSDMCLETISTLGQLKAETEIKESKSIFNEDTNICDSSMDIFEFRNEAPHVFDDSSMVFKDCKCNEENHTVTGNVDSGVKEHQLTIDDDSSVLADNDILIPNLTKNKSNLPVRNVAVDTSEESDGKTSNHCPICFKTTSKYISHMKACAAKSNLTTEQLLSVLQLHKRQMAERKEFGLGLPIPTFRAKGSPKKIRTVDKKVFI